MEKTILSTALLAVLGVSGLATVSTQAATLNTGDTLTINTGVQQYDANGNFVTVSPGSWFGMDWNFNGKISGDEKTALAQGTTGLVIGVTTSPGASHVGCPVAGDTNAITAPWCIGNITGSDYVTTMVTGGTTGLDMSGWTWTWNGTAAILMGADAWGTGYSNGVGNFVWDGVYGDAYTLDYHATVPLNDPSGLGGVRYALHLEGFVKPVPVPAAVWLLGSGLVGLVGVVRRRKNVA
jgi:hypothetical protein